MLVYKKSWFTLYRWNVRLFGGSTGRGLIIRLYLGESCFRLYQQATYLQCRDFVMTEQDQQSGREGSEITLRMVHTTWWKKITSHYTYIHPDDVHCNTVVKGFDCKFKTLTCYQKEFQHLTSWRESTILLQQHEVESSPRKWNVFYCLMLQ